MGVYNRASATSSYEITDHLGNVRAVVDRNGVIKSYANYYPFGEQLPSLNSLSNYRYTFQGQELDTETNMEAFQLRLWDGRIGRWLSPDPYGQHDSPYAGMGNNPVSHIDPDGGYETWLGAFFGWVGGGFKGSVISNPAGENNTNTSRNYGVLLKNGYFKEGSGNNLGEIGLPVIRYHDKPSSFKLNDYYFKELGTPVFIIPAMGGNGITLPFGSGGFILAGNKGRGLIQHERGHIEQIRELGGISYLKNVGIPSFYNGIENSIEESLYGSPMMSIPHEEYLTETDANIKAFWLYNGNFRHRERSVGIEPYNPLIGRASNSTVLERLYFYYKTIHPLP